MAPSSMLTVEVIEGIWGEFVIISHWCALETMGVLYPLLFEALKRCLQREEGGVTIFLLLGGVSLGC